MAIKGSSGRLRSEIQNISEDNRIKIQNIVNSDGWDEIIIKSDFDLRETPDELKVNIDDKYLTFTLVYELRKNTQHKISRRKLDRGVISTLITSIFYEGEKAINDFNLRY